jgi:bacterioferritin-associated ferredoxin
MDPLIDTADACTGSCRTCPAVGSCPDRVVCRCLKVTEEVVITAVTAHGVRTVKELRQVTGAGTGCTCCHQELRVYLEVYGGRTVPLPTAAAS